MIVPEIATVVKTVLEIVVVYFCVAALALWWLYRISERNRRNRPK